MKRNSKPKKKNVELLLRFLKKNKTEKKWQHSQDNR